MAAHGAEPGVDDALFAALNLVHGGAHVVVDPAPGDAAQGLEGPGVGVKEHLVSLARVGDQPEGPTGAELEVGHLDVVEDTTDDHGLVAPVELEGLPELEAQRDECFGWTGRRFDTPAADVVGHGAVATPVALRLDLGEERSTTASALFGAVAVGGQRLVQDRLERGELARDNGSLVLGHGIAGRLEPLLDRVAR